MRHGLAHPLKLGDFLGQRFGVLGGVLPAAMSLHRTGCVPGLSALRPRFLLPFQKPLPDALNLPKNSAEQLVMLGDVATMLEPRLA